MAASREVAPITAEPSVSAVSAWVQQAMPVLQQHEPVQVLGGTLAPGSAAPATASIALASDRTAEGVGDGTVVAALVVCAAGEITSAATTAVGAG